eukprot:11161827-Lingulodinium_polyedra.AAC.1
MHGCITILHKHKVWLRLVFASPARCLFSAQAGAFVQPSVLARACLLLPVWRNVSVGKAASQAGRHS